MEGKPLTFALTRSLSLNVRGHDCGTVFPFIRSAGIWFIGPSCLKQELQAKAGTVLEREGTCLHWMVLLPTKVICRRTATRKATISSRMEALSRVQGMMKVFIGARQPDLDFRFIV